MICFVLETELDVLDSVRGSCNPVDVGLETRSPLMYAVPLMFTNGKLQDDMSSCDRGSRYLRVCDFSKHDLS